MIYAYIGTYTHDRSEGIFVYRYDPATARLDPVGSVVTLANPTFLTVHPSKKYVYAVSETDNYLGKPQAAVSAYAINKDTGALTLVNHVASPGNGACHIALSPDSRHGVIANYGDGSVAVLPVNRDGSLGEATDFVKHAGHGPHPNQTVPHAHCTKFGPDGRMAHVADLGLDKLFAYRLVDGKLVAGDTPYTAVQSGAGPRHITFHQNGAVGYVINELDNTIVVLDVDRTTGELRPKQTVRTLPEDFLETSYCADIHVHPSGKFVYGSNRGHDSIAMFNVGATGLLTPLGHQSTLGHWPRNFAIDPAGEFMLVANERTDNIVAFKIDLGTGLLAPTGFVATVPKPVCIQFVEM